MPRSPAITNLGNRNPELFLQEVAHGIDRLIANSQRLDASAQRLSQAGDEASATLLGSFADEEAAKVLILMDAVRCPAAETEARTRTLKRWSDHLWKGIYVRSCDWSVSNFQELKSYIDAELRPFYLDGPMDVDWIFRNEIRDQRERQIYVDLVEDITETGGDRQNSWWAAPEDFSSAGFKYRTSRCVHVAASLHALGFSTERGLEHVAKIWQPIDPTSMDYSEMLTKIRETLLAVQSDERESSASSQGQSSPNALAEWPYPLWPIEEPESTSTSTYLDALRKAREAALNRIDHIQGLKNPPPAISREKVLEMHQASALVEKEIQRRIDSHSAGKSGMTFISVKLHDVSNTPAWLRLRELWWGLSEEERVSLVALAWFTRDTIANWPDSLKQAQERGDIHSTQAERYYLGLSREWLAGYRRWETPSDQVWVGRE